MADDTRPPSRSVRPGDLPGPRQQPPPDLFPGTRVAGYEVEARLGAGGYGTVYRARSGSTVVALKLLPLELSGGWEDREVDVLRRLKHPNIMRLLGYVDWPEEEPAFRVLVMEYVDGLPVDEWARRHNPSALEVVDLLLPLLDALEAVHAAGVRHRDVKAPNILVRASNGQPVLVDFGAGAYPGAPTLTTSVLPPGTPEYRSPEAWDFFRRHVGESGVRYQPRPSDDLWPVGILLYWLLTDRLPFTGRDFLMIGTAVLNETPVPPDELNPRAPEALVGVCLRMLEKAPEDRYADAGELRAELLALKAEADASWRTPLFEPRGLHNVTTEPMGQLARGQDLRMRMERLAQEPPRRGEVPLEQRTPETPAPSANPRSPWRLPVLVLGSLALGAALGLLPWWVTHLSSEVGPTTQPFQSPEAFPIHWDTFVQDVAPPRKTPDVVGDAAPHGKDIPTPVINANYSEKDMRVKKTPQKVSVKPHASRCLGLGLAAALAAGCTPPSLIQQSFIDARDWADKQGDERVKRGYDNVLECKPEWVENMKKKGIAVGSVQDNLFSPLSYRQPPETVTQDLLLTDIKLNAPWGALPARGMLGGMSVVKQNRIYTRLFGYGYPTPGLEGEYLCMEVWYDGEPGAPYLGKNPDRPRTGVLTVPRIQLKAVDKFH